MNKPYAESCVQNRTPIFSVIAPLFAQCQKVLEIGSGTGQHAVYFAKDLPHLHWHTSDCVHNHAGIQAWLAEAKLANIHPPLALCIPDDPLPAPVYDAVFAANVLHIMDMTQAAQFFHYAAQALKPSGLLVVYGPFNENGSYTSASNARFDQWLKQQHPDSCIKDRQQLVVWAEQQGLGQHEVVEMPANNRMLLWRKQ